MARIRCLMRWMLRGANPSRPPRKRRYSKNWRSSTKATSLFSLTDAVQAVAQGKPWYSPRVQAEVAAWLRGEHALPPELAALTEREREVLRHLAQGASNQEIADALDISINTVAQHVSHLLGKLGCTSRVEAAVRAVKAGWLRWI
jgi:DNA-binding NarL/FixJ family response regulator